MITGALDRGIVHQVMFGRVNSYGTWGRGGHGDLHEQLTNLYQLSIVSLERTWVGGGGGGVGSLIVSNFAGALV